MPSLRGLLGRKGESERMRAQDVDSERVAARLDRIMRRDDDDETHSGDAADRRTDRDSTDIDHESA